MSIVLTLLPITLVAANYLFADIRDRRRRPEGEAICG